jgi:isoleucyl-tRNA synthetase
MTLYTALVTVAKAAAPMVPFMTEDMYQNLVCGIDAAAPESIHLCDFPTVNEQWIDKELETNMELVLEIVVLGRSARNTANIKNRQPIGNMYVKAAAELNDFYKKIVEEELNVKAVTFKDDMEEYLTYSFKPQFKVLGPKVGKQIGEIKAALVTVNGHEAKEELDKTGELKLTLKTGEVILLAEDMEVSMAQTEGYVSDRYNGVIVALETTLSQELLEEGFVREVISKLQTMRKDNKFEVMDRITVYVNGNEKIAKLMTANATTIKDIVLGNEIHVGSMAGFTKEWNINGEKVELGIQ